MACRKKTSTPITPADDKAKNKVPEEALNEVSGGRLVITSTGPEPETDKKKDKLELIIASDDNKTVSIR